MNLVLIKYLESFLISFVFIGAGWLIESGDPCFLESKINLSLFVMAVLTLFYGWSGFFSFLVVYMISLHLFYDTFYLYQLLQLTALGLILFVFHFIWDKKIENSKVKEEYLNRKLTDNVNAFYMLKISYDRLERAYITKPFSLKDSLDKIAKLSKKESFSAKKEFLRFLSQVYQIKKSLIVEYGEDDFKSEEEFDKNDPLIKKAIEKRVPVYTDLDPNGDKTGSLAVIPFFLEEERGCLLVIKDMLFKLFNKDTLLQVAVIFGYFIQSMEKEKFIKLHNCYQKNYLDENFAFELCRLKNIYKVYNIRSSVAVLKSKNYEFMKKLLFLTREQKRAVDEIQTLVTKENYYVIIVLFPFSDKKSVMAFLLRLKDEAYKDQTLSHCLRSEEFIYKVGDINQNPLENLLLYR